MIGHGNILFPLTAVNGVGFSSQSVITGASTYNLETYFTAIFTLKVFLGYAHTHRNTPAHKRKNTSVPRQASCVAICWCARLPLPNAISWQLSVNQPTKWISTFFYLHESLAFSGVNGLFGNVDKKCVTSSLFFLNLLQSHSQIITISRNSPL